MSDELDLELGDANRAERILAAGKESGPRGKRARSTSSAKRTTGTKASSEAEERSLKSDLLEMFSDFSEQFTADPELKDILERRKEAMSQGLVALTRKIPFVRSPLKLIVALFQPTVAFWELGGYGVRRYLGWRNRIALQQRAEANGDTDVAHVPGSDGYATA